ncbi:MAG: hypothetical protein KIS77_10160 [Saprospiraceae bacterium]|nr:hypothetical protein [Saprospiraceae bacterium]
MKQFFSFILVCSMLGQASVRTAWTLHYQWNRAVYLKNCENRDKPEMQCDGKCYLKKQMAVSEQSGPKEPQLPEGFHQVRDIQLFFESAALFPRFCASGLLAESRPAYLERRLPDAPHAAIFKPPAA